MPHSAFPESVSISSGFEDCVLDGSHHVQELGLDKRFMIAVTMDFKWKNPQPPAAASDSSGISGSVPSTTEGVISADGSILVEVSGVMMLKPRLHLSGQLLKTRTPASQPNGMSMGREVHTPSMVRTVLLCPDHRGCMNFPYTCTIHARGRIDLCNY